MPHKDRPWCQASIVWCSLIINPLFDRGENKRKEKNLNFCEIKN